MKSPKNLLAIAIILLVAACGSNGNTPEPKKTTEEFGFTVAAQYIAEAALGANNTQRIVVTVGKPLTAIQQAQAKRPLLCSTISRTDLFIPVHLEVVNTSRADAPTATIGSSLQVVADANTIGRTFMLGLQIDDANACQPQNPLKDTTTKAISSNYPATPIVNWSPTNRPTKRGQSIAAPMHLLLGGGGVAPTPPVSALFLRLTPVPDEPGNVVRYRITKLAAAKGTGGLDAVPGVAGVISAGPDQGAFYVPLEPNTSPCDTIGKGAAMNCGSTVTAP